jgi:hypothetical protein
VAAGRPRQCRQAQRAHRRERLADRVRLNQAAGLPPPVPPLVGVTAPQIDHQPAIAPRSERRAGTRLRIENTGEAVTYRAEPPVGKTLDLHAAIIAP